MERGGEGRRVEGGEHERTEEKLRKMGGGKRGKWKLRGRRKIGRE